MPSFAVYYKEYIKTALKADRQFGFDLHAIARVEPLLSFLYKEWWRVQLAGMSKIPTEGPVLIVGNSAGLVPWPAFMLMYALMSNSEAPRRLNIVGDLDWVNDERLYSLLVKIGFVPWSSANLKHLFSKGEIVAVFPEGLSATCKPFTDRYRMLDFDWTRLLPAVEEGIPIYPMATIGCEESIPTIANLDRLAKFLNMPAFPVTPFFPWFPFPFNLGSLPVQWHMKLLGNQTYPKATKNRDKVEETAKTQSRFIEGEIQAELNRMLRARSR
jgi:1-acyl-sn-glycerol-3-phosphate acyltransferase